MKKRGRLGYWLGFGALALVLLCAAVVALIYSQVRSRAFNSRPLVLIQSPVNHEQAQIGDGLTVHATARAARGVSRIELWVDDAFVEARDNPAEGPASPLVLSASWTPASIGSHVLLVRAISADRVDGQATVVIEVVGEAGAALGGYTMQEGETLASIAEQYGVSPEELGALNPDVDPGGVEAGDELTVPGGEGASDEPAAEAPAESFSDMGGDEAVPAPEDEAPGDFLHVVLSVIPLDLIPEPAPSDEPVSLRLEALNLRSDAAYEGLNCYISVAGGLPRSYPDTDGDQLTHEWFLPLAGNTWNVAEHLSGEAAPVITWPGNQPLTLDATCVGIRGGGTDAIQLGRLLLEIPPSEWDGVARWSPTASDEGSFTLEYRVGPGIGQAVAGRLDPSMTPPTNLRLAGYAVTGYSLYWSYEPRGDEDPIDGFRIYLNGTLLWVEPADARTTLLPSQWLSPCVEPYTFTVTAFRGTYPDGPESTTSDPPVVIEAEPEHCQRVVYVTFLNLITHDLGGDGSFRHLSGDVGPAYGSFYANDQQVSFDGRPGPFNPLGLSHNSQYVIHDLLWDWNRSGPSQFRVELAENEYLEVGFRIDDEDKGSCNGAGDPDCPDLICEAEQMQDVDVDTTSEVRTLVSDDGRCEVTYTLGIGAGFPAEAYGGELPLPWLTVDDVTMVEASQLRIHIRNDGRASWPAREVKAAIARPSGEIVDTLSWPDISLAPGETTILQTATMDFGALPVCVILDPDNEVEEEGDRLESTGVLSGHRQTCMQLPDLVITGVEYDPGASHLLVTVENQGEGQLENRTIALSLAPLLAGPAAPPVEQPSISLGPSESTVLTMTANEGLHSGWFGGYIVRVDPHDLVAESNNDNNSHTVPGGTRLELVWTGIRAPWQARNRVDFELKASIVSAGSPRQVADWKVEQNIDWNTCGHDLSHGECDRYLGGDSRYDTYWFNIAGDEALQINVTVNHSLSLRDDFGQTFTWLATGETFGVADGWGAGDWDNLHACTDVFEGPGDHEWVLGSYSEWAPTLGYWHDWDWSVNFNLCHEPAGG